MKYFLSVILFFSIQTEWFKNTEKSILNIDRNVKLISEFEKIDKDGKTIIKKYKTEKEAKTVIQYKYGESMNIDISFYENRSQLFAEITKGKTGLIYKRKRQKNEPYAVLLESRTYFKDKTQGIKKYREIKVYENSNIEKLKITLESTAFEIKKIGEKEFQDLKEKYNRINNWKE